MTLDEAIENVARRFPFADYMTLGGRPRCVYASLARAVQRHLPSGGRILDFGCGPCDKTAVLQAIGYRCSAYDDLQDDWHRLPGNLDRIIGFARESGIDFRLADGGPLPFVPDSFDMVTMLDVLEHLHDSPREILNDVLCLLRPGGQLFVTVPNAVNIRKRLAVLRGQTNLPPFAEFYWYPGPWRGHVREYVRDDLARAAEYLGLEVLELHGCDHMLEKLPPAVRPLYLGVTALFPGWKDSWLLVARKPERWQPKRTLSATELNRMLGRASWQEFSAH